MNRRTGVYKMSKKKLATLITTVAFASGTALSLVGCAGGNSTGGQYWEF